MRPITPEQITRHFIRLVRREDLPPIRLHDLRHGAATLALAAGADLKAIQAMLGHASIVLTADTYTSVLPDIARQTAQAIAAAICPDSRSRLQLWLQLAAAGQAATGVSAGQTGWGRRGANPEPTD